MGNRSAARQATTSTVPNAAPIAETGPDWRVAVALGVMLLVVALTVSIFIPYPTPFQYSVFRVLLALAAAGVVVVLPGALYARLEGAGAVVAASGAIAAFVIVFFWIPTTKIALTPPSTATTFEFNASSFSRQQNVFVDNREPCRAGMVYNASDVPRPNLVQYDFEVEAAGPYRLLVEYAALDSRPVNIELNGTLIAQGALSATTGGWCNSDAQRAPVANVQLKKGKNVLVIRRESVFPHLAKIRFEPVERRQ